MSNRHRLRVIIRPDNHFLEWFVLSELQTCSSSAAYLDKKDQLSEFMEQEFIDRKALYYGICLLEEVRRDNKTGLVWYSDRIKSRPTPPKPQKRGSFKLYLNENWRLGDDLKL